MNILYILIRRDLIAAFRSSRGKLPLVLLLAISGWVQLVLLRRFEGSTETFASIWALATAPWTIFYAAILATQGFVHERSLGMMPLIYSTPIRARTWVVARTLSLWCCCVVFLLFSLLQQYLVLKVYPAQTITLEWTRVGLTLMMLSLQALVWCSVAMLASFFSKTTTGVTIWVISLCGILPIAVRILLQSWFPLFQGAWFWSPIHVHVYDCAWGLVSLPALFLYLSLSFCALFSAGVLFDTNRFLGVHR